MLSTVFEIKETERALTGHSEIKKEMSVNIMWKSWGTEDELSTPANEPSKPAWGRPPSSGVDQLPSAYCDELSFWFLTCRSFTTCFTLGTLVATCSARLRLFCELTSPVSVTTPLFTAYFTLSCILFWISAASRFFSMPSSRSEFRRVLFRSDRKSTRLNSSHLVISYAVFCLDQKSTRLNSIHLVISYAVSSLDDKSDRLR